MCEEVTGSKVSEAFLRLTIQCFSAVVASRVLRGDNEKVDPKTSIRNNQGVNQTTIHKDC